VAGALTIDKSCTREKAIAGPSEARERKRVKIAATCLPPTPTSAASAKANGSQESPLESSPDRLGHPDRGPTRPRSRYSRVMGIAEPQHHSPVLFPGDNCRALARSPPAGSTSPRSSLLRRQLRPHRCPDRPVRRGLPAPVRQGLELGDALIAASASVHNLILRTRNRRHYPMKTLAFY
jgi:hypothetical protein